MLVLSGKHLFIVLVSIVILPTTWLRNLGVLAYVSASGVLESVVLVFCVLNATSSNRGPTLRLPVWHKKVGDDAGYGAHTPRVHEATADRSAGWTQVYLRWMGTLLQMEMQCHRSEIPHTMLILAKSGTRLRAY